jgi:hypothetical protein
VVPRGCAPTPIVLPRSAPPPRSPPLPVRTSQAYYILDELLLGGELQETNKREVLRVATAQDDLMAEDEAALLTAMNIKRR